MDKATLKEVALEQKNLLKEIDLGVKREKFDEAGNFISMPHAIIISGIRRSGKSTLLHQIASEFYKDSVYYLSFEDERLIEFQKDDFNNLYEIFTELFGKRKVMFFDEIQNVPSWEMFVRRMQDRGFKFLVTGSNASLLSKELGTKLTGRVATVELYPFSFKEFLLFHKYELSIDMLNHAAGRGKVRRYFNQYLKCGGMPEFLKYKDSSILKRIYDDILYRDIVSRYDVKEIKALRELGLYLLTNISGLFSYNSLKKLLGLGSVNTVKSYIEYMENSFLIFTVNKFSYSLKEQFMNNRKVYCIDTGLAEAVSFRFSKDRGKFLENLVFLGLKRRYTDIYYYKTENNQEVDFLIRNTHSDKMLIQVTEHLNNEKTRKRELGALLSAMKEQDIQSALILTEDTEEKIKIKNKNIAVKPIYKWLLTSE